MKSSFLRRAAVLGAVSLGALASTGTATAATGSLGCTASVGRAAFTSPFAATVNPVVANRQVNPCVTRSIGTQPRTIVLPNNYGTITIGRSGAFTDTTAGSDPTENLAPGVASFASTSDIKVVTQQGSFEASTASATATEACANGALQTALSSSVGDLIVNGKPYVTPDLSGAPFQVNFGQNGSYIAINKTTVNGDTLTRDAIFVHIANVGDFVLAEATVNHPGVNVCAGQPGLPPILTVCPGGATFDPATLQCVIGTITRVGSPFTGPTGGVVIPLTIARHLYKSPCLSGAGPNYVVVATGLSHRIDGTKHADRILGLSYNARIAGLAGNDCIDGGSGKDLLFDGSGNVRVFAGNGHDRIAVGNGNATIKAGNGGDWISAGRGNVTVTAGNGSDRIDLGRGKDHVHTGKGKDRVFVPGTRSWVACGSVKDLLFINRKASKYAYAHGCLRMRWVH